MSDEIVYLLGIGATVVLSLAVVLYLRPHMIRVLTDLCGTLDRARFWSALSVVTLVLLPLLCALSRTEFGESGSVVFDVASILWYSLAGLIAGVGMIGLSISLFISMEPTRVGRSPVPPGTNHQSFMRNSHS